MGGCTASSLRIPSEKKFRRAIKLYEVTEVSSLTNLFNRNKCFEGGESPLTLAAQEGHEAVVQALVQHGADVNRLDKKGRGALHLATQLNDLETVDILLKHKANPRRYDDYNGTTPLHIACERGYSQIVEKLLDSGADSNENERTFPPIIYAVLYKHPECVKVLLNHGAKTNVTDARGNTALHIAVTNKDVEIVKMLLEYDADPYAKTRDDDTLVCLASLTDSPSVLQALIQHDCDTDDHRTDEPPALVAAVVRGNIEVVDLLIAANANVNINDKRKQSVLQIACMGIADMDKENFYARYFSNVYRMYAKYDPDEVSQENSCQCAMSLVQAGADVTRVWERFSQIFPDPRGSTFEQMVLCEVLIQAYGFHQLSKIKLNNFINKVLDAREYGLLKLVYSAGVDPSLDVLSELATRQDDDSRETFIWVKKLMRNPRQLKDLCRQKIRVMLSWNVLYLVEQLPIPSETKEYICIMDTEYYSSVVDDSG